MSKKQLPETMTLIRDNILENKNPLAVSAKENAQWAKDLHLPKKGKLLFYTGGEYQLLPFIDSLLKVMDLVDPGSMAFSWMMSMRDLAHTTGLVPEKIFASVFAQDKKRFFDINRKAAAILMHLGYDICYNGEAEIYSGALLHEMGFKDALALYSRDINRFLNESGAETVVCLSPHAAEVFKYVYPAFKDFPDIQIKTFPELLWARRDRLPSVASSAKFVVHDSCRLAREMGVVSELRDILDAAEVNHVDPTRSGVWTTCCGGPIKMVYPELSHRLAEQRYEELTATGANKAVVACPFCLSALKSAGKSLEIVDLAELIMEGFAK